MQKINLNSKEALVIDVPDNSKDIKITVTGLGRDVLCYNGRGGPFLPEGNWSILGTLTNGVPDFDVREYVDFYVNLQGLYISGKKVIIVKNDTDV